MTAALNDFLATNVTSVVIRVATTPVYVDCTNFDPMLFTSILLTGPVRAATGTSAGTYVATVTTTPAQIATAAANAHAAQQTAAAAVLVATLPAIFNLLTLPTDVKTCHLHHLDPSYLLTQSDMVPFQVVTGGACPSPSHLDPPMGTGVTRQPDSNRVIAPDGQFLSLADQGNTGLKVFFSSVPACVRTSSEAIRT